MNRSNPLAKLAPALAAAMLAACVASADPNLAELAVPRVDEHSAVLRWDVQGDPSTMKPVLRQPGDLELHRLTQEGSTRVQVDAVETAPGLCVLSRLPEGDYEAKLKLTSAGDATRTSVKTTRFTIRPAPIPVQLGASAHFELAAPIGIENALVVNVADGKGASGPGSDAIRERADWLLREYVRATIGPSSRHSLDAIERSRTETENGNVGYQLDARDPILVVVQLDAPDAADGTCQLALKIFDLALTRKTLDSYTSWLNRPLVYSEVVEIDPVVSKGDPSTSLALFEGWKALVHSLAASPRWNAYLELVRGSEGSAARFADSTQTDLVKFLQLECAPVETSARAESCFFPNRLDVELPPSPPAPPPGNPETETTTERPADDEKKVEPVPPVEGASIRPPEGEADRRSDPAAGGGGEGRS